MKCELCKKSVQVNYGNGNHIFCKECSISDTAKQIIEQDVETKITKNNNIDVTPKIPFIGIVIIMVVYGLAMLLFYQLFKYDTQIALLVIAAIIILYFIRDIAMNIYSQKLINNNIIARTVKNKINQESICGIIMLSTSIIGFILVAKQINDYYQYLLQENYIRNWFQLLNSEYISNLESYANKNNDIMLLHTTLTVQSRLLSLYNVCALLVVGVSQLHHGLRSDAISEIGILRRGDVLKWKEFTSYSWSEYYQDKNTKSSSGYYNLELVSENGKILTYILGEEEFKRDLKIRVQDKDKVDQLLRCVITN